MGRPVFSDLGLLGLACFGGCALVALGGWLVAFPLGGADASPGEIYLALAGPASAVWLGLAVVVSIVDVVRERQLRPDQK